MGLRRKIAALALAVAAAACIVTVPAQHAGASGTTCNALNPDGCLFWDNFFNTNNYGSSLNGWFTDIGDYVYYSFLGPGPGQWEGVKNNAASARNWHGTLYMVVFYNENCSGPYDLIAPWHAGDLVDTWNDNASHCFL